MSLPSVYLAKGQDRRVRAGHCWVYSNELDHKRSPIKDLPSGQAIDLLNAQGKWMGSGYVNAQSLIAVRIVSRDRDHPLTVSLLVHRFKIALGLRDRLYAKPFYRMVFAESDGLPGLVIDRFDSVLVVQITTAGMELMKDSIIEALTKLLKPEAILLRNDVAIRKLEGLDLYTQDCFESLPESIQLEEHGVKFEIPLQGGQKTGWFYDQADNRQRLIRYIEGKRVLDVCSYIGAWGVQAAVNGASDVVCVDSSASALEGVQNNAKLNGVDDRMSAYQGDAFDVMKSLRNERERFDVVLVDPPAFIKKRKDIKAGTEAYKRLNGLALQLLSKDGLLVSSSCSHHMSADALLTTIQQAGRHNDRALQMLERGQQAPDHPVHPAIVETSYLKSYFLRVLPSF